MTERATATRIGPAQAASTVMDALDAGEAIAVAMLVSSSAPGAGRPGDRLLLRERDESEELAGTLGSAPLDAAAAEVAREALAGAGPATHELTLGGESVRVFVEAHLPPDELLIVGAGHIAVPLARVGAMLGFRVTVLDDREEFASEARFPEAVRVLRTELEPPADPFRAVRLTRRSYVVLVTRAHRYDFDCLSALLRPDRPVPRYLGMIGSRRRVRGAFEALLREGMPRERLARVHAPIGLDIGAETPEEIAISIAAEIVRVRRGHSGSTAPRSELEQVLARLLPEESA
ncbi:MAG TPA: XdhC family protein [Longimicrobiales bacterium]